MDTDVSHDSERILRPRAYQIEMLEESLRRNVIVAMDTGSGKTNIAILRIAAELERCPPQKLVWFLCPTIALAQQQHDVLTIQLPAFQSRLLSGNDGVDRWSEQATWDDVLRNMNIVVCTHQVLLDALIHGFVQMTKIALLIFDEAHHCVRNHAAKRIMQNFYHPIRQERPDEVPGILGLTASPVMRKNPDGLETIEQNLNAISKTPKIHRDELMRYVHRPDMVVLIYPAGEAARLSSLRELNLLYSTLDIEQDPYVNMLRAENHKKYLQVLLSRKTYCQEQMKRLLRVAIEVNNELGSWTSDLYIYLCIRKFQAHKQSAFGVLEDMNVAEKSYLEKLFGCLQLRTIDMSRMLYDQDLSSKTIKLVAVLAREMYPGSAGIVFVQTRAAVKLLSILLMMHSSTKDILRIGTFVGTSNNQARSSYISDLINTNDQKETLNDLRNGTINLIIATSICEEGIDISTCNLVVCFEKPPNLKSFIQRRGRARSTKSKYIIMLPEGEENAAVEWQSLEAVMIEKYMDDMRELGELQKLEDQEEGHREFVVGSTGAKITLYDALQHLHHFCKTLPSAPYVELAPTFIFENHVVTDEISCRVILPNNVHSSIQEFCSVAMWKTQRLARMDAAFEAYVGLYHAGLVNNNLLPSPEYDDEIARCFAEVAKRPAKADINGEFNPWPSVAELWDSTSKVSSSIIKIRSSGETIQMKMVSPRRLPPISTFTLYLDAKITLQVDIDEETETVYDQKSIAIANEITRLFFSSAFPNRTKENGSGFPILFLPLDILDDPQTWLDSMKGTYSPNDILSGMSDPAVIGLIKDVSHGGKTFVFHGIEQNLQDPNETETPIHMKTLLKVKRLSKRVDFLHKVPLDAVPTTDEFTYLDPNRCIISRLSMSYSKFAMYIPSIMHRIEKVLLVDHACRGVLAPIELSSRRDVLCALCSPAAREEADYQRLEFLGDSILKTLTSIALMADHLLWHEGYLSHAKDHIVSNGRLALAAQETGLDKYILTSPFTGKKWQPLYNTDLLSAQPPPQRELSTKTLADVVEALIGAAFLDGGFPKALSCLRIFLPEIDWLPLTQRSETLLSVVPASNPSSSHPQNLRNLESILSHTFAHPLLLVEAITHPSHLSIPPTPSYQRLEYLGDALLDYLVTRAIWSHTTSSALTVPRMHLLRTAAVNASFLAFCALAHTLTLPIATLTQCLTPCRKRDRDQIHPVSLSNSTTALSLPLFLRHAPIPALASALRATRTRFDLLHPTIRTALDDNQDYPWRALAAFAPEKLVSDMVESVLGAVYIDTNGDLAVCELVVREFGILGWVEQALNGGGNLLHPKQEVGLMAGQERVKYAVWIEEEKVKKGSDRGSEVADDAGPCGKPDEEGEDKRGEEDLVLGKGRYRCRISVGEREVCIAQGWNRVEVETAAAEEAVRILGEEKKGRGEGEIDGTEA